jgi:hypothetical protein
VTLALAIIAVCFSGLSLVVAGYAAVNAHKARTWQERRDRERRATAVRIEFRHATAREPFYVATAGNIPVTPFEYQLALVAINDGEGTEYVTWAAIERADGSQGTALYGDETDVGERQAVEPRSSATFEHRLDRDEIARFADGVVGVVQLASGTVIRSEVERFHPDLVEDVGKT